MIVEESSMVWLRSADISLVFLLGIGTFANIIRLKYSQKHSFNDLTMVPYYFVIAYSAFAVIQFTMILKIADENIILVINVIKINLIYTAIATQIYEWFCILKMINFQKNYNLKTVGAARDKFRPIEKRHFLIFKTIIISFFIATITLSILSFLPFFEGYLKADV